MEAGAEPTIAVAVVSWNTRELLSRCLDAFLPDVSSGLAEVWVVDNASSDGSPAMVRERHPWARLIESQVNLGFGAAVNAVAARTSSAWIAAANADIAPTPGALARLLAAGSEAGVGAVAPRLVQPDGRTQYTIHSFPSLRATLLFNLGLRSVAGAAERATLPATWDPDRGCDPDWAHGALLLLRRSAWDEVGGFDDRHWMYAEDLDLCWRLRRAGWRTRYEPAARFRHEVGAATGAAEWGAARDVRAQRAAYAWMLEHLGSPATRLIAAVNIVGAAVRWIVAAAGSALSPRRFGPRRRLYARAWRAHLTGLAPRARLLRGR